MRARSNVLVVANRQCQLVAPQDALRKHWIRAAKGASYRYTAARILRHSCEHALVTQPDVDSGCRCRVNELLGIGIDCFNSVRWDEQHISRV
jgi:hypothetical protein